MNSKYALPKDGGLIVDSAPSDIIRRYEKIPASVFEHESEGVGYVADLIVRAIKKHNEYSLSNEIFEDVQPFVLDSRPAERRWGFTTSWCAATGTAW